MDSPNGWTTEQSETKVRIARGGCLDGAAAMFLWPVVFIMTFSFYGIHTAAWVLLAIAVLRWVFRTRRNKRNSRERIPEDDAIWAINSIVGIASIVAYLASGEILYIQLLPTANCFAFAAMYSQSWMNGASMIKNKNSDMASVWQPADVHLLHACVFLLVIGAAVPSEHVRVHATLAEWVLYFAFFRVELLAGSLAAMMPVTAKLFWRS